MRAGTLNRRVQIQKPVTTTDADGTESIVWTNVSTLWANINELQGTDRLEAEQLQHPLTVQVTVRYQPSNKINPAMRVVYGNRVFEVHSVVPDQEPPRSLTLFSVELHP